MKLRFRNYIWQWAATLMLCFGLWVGIGTLLNMPGCETGQTQEELNVAQATYDEALLLINAAADEAAELTKKEDKTPEEEAALAKANATIATLRKALEKAVDADGNVTPASGLTALTTFIPPPWNVPSGILVGMVGTWMKGRKSRKSFKALVGAINTVKQQVPGFASAIDGAGPRLKEAMGPKASAVVDVARKEGKFPVV